MSQLLIGCIADDFTGAGDAASLLASNGLRTLLLIDQQPTCDLRTYDAVVIALKCRSQERSIAIQESLSALDWLKEQGAQKLYFKYCSTFDSTKQGNIGPIVDAILEHYSQHYTILCPSMLENGRTVKDSILYVNGVPLSESHMKNHPLNPMWDSSISNLMKPQSKYPCFTFTEHQIRDKEFVDRTIQDLSVRYEHFYLVLDYYEPEHGSLIANRFSSLPIWTGGSGLLAEFAKLYSITHPDNYIQANDTSDDYGRVIFAGSCSNMTQTQVKTWLENGKRGVEIKPDKIYSGEQTPEKLIEIAQSDPADDILFYSSGSIGKRNIDDSKVQDSEIIEQVISETAQKLVAKIPINRLIIAGGETSGAVIKALGYSAFQIGESQAPGVPILHPIERPSMQIVLKSGNFGSDDFFLKTLK